MHLILYAYPLWALVAFGMAMIHLVTHFWINHDRQTLLWGIVFLGWSVAFFGAGLLIARIGNQATVRFWVEMTWVVMLPVFAVTVLIESVRLWRVLKELDDKRRK